MSVVWRQQVTRGSLAGAALPNAATLLDRDARTAGSVQRAVPSLGFRRPVLADRPASAA
jgi:hypothetical protein